MAFDDDFQNLATVLGAGVPVAPTDAERVRERLDGLIAGLGVSANRRGGTIYIPRLPGAQLWVDVTRPLSIPREVTVVVAPGAVIVPVYTGAGGEGGARYLEIEGVLDAPIATVFATPGWFARKSPAGAARYQVGAVRLSSPHLERVHPEWWGAGDPRDPERPSDSEALIASLHAAVRDRVREATSQRAPLRPLPVELRGSYTLGRTLEIHAGTVGSEQGLELRGAAGAPDAPTFRSVEGFTLGDAMVVIQGMKAVVLEDLRFDGGTLAGTCLRITDEDRARADDASGVPADRPHLVRRCEFQGALGPLVSYAIHDPSATELALRKDGIHLEHCAFRPGGVHTEVPEAALALDGPPTAAVDVRGCTFRGEASAMIRATTCALTVASCNFANASLPLLAADATSTDVMHGGGPTGGVDLFLDARADAPASALYAQDCRSTSPQFLVTRMGPMDHGVSVTVVGLHYSRRPGPAFRLEPIYVHEDRPRWFWDVFEMTPVTYQPVSGSKLELPAKVPPGKLPIAGVKGTFDVSTVLTPETVAGTTPGGKQFPTEAPPKVPQVTASVGTPAVPAILWRLPGAGSNLTLMGCRFDFPPLDMTVAVRGTAEAGSVVDLGVLRSSDNGVNAVSVSDAARRVVVPLWPRLQLRVPTP